MPIHKVIITNTTGNMINSGTTDGLVHDNAIFVTVKGNVRIYEVWQVFKKEYSKQVWKELQPFISNDELRANDSQQYIKNVQTKLKELAWAYGFREMVLRK